MDFSRRLKLFLIGIGFGTIIMYFVVLKDRNIYKTPEEIIKIKLSENPLTYSQHGSCRMKCRSISEAEVKELLKSGEVNYGKSKVHDKPCPGYAFEGKTADGQNIRVVFALCEKESRVITAIDLDQQADTCSCN
jgi:hypothetical protein